MILGTMSNDIYIQIALIMLMGLLAKNAILIVEFALDHRQARVISWAAVLVATIATDLNDLIGHDCRFDSVDVGYGSWC